MNLASVAPLGAASGFGVKGLRVRAFSCILEEILKKSLKFKIGIWPNFFDPNVSSIIQFTLLCFIP